MKKQQTRSRNYMLTYVVGDTVVGEICQCDAGFKSHADMRGVRI
jgi:hypothetical protein